MLKNKLSLIGIIIIAILIFVAIFAPYIAPYDPIAQNVINRLQPPSAQHFLGTDELGRDVFSRLVYGARVSLAVGFVSVGISVLIGTILGLISGYYGGWIDNLIMRFVDIMLCFPSFFLILMVIAFLQPSIYNVMIVIGLTSWPSVTRLVRGQCLSLRNREFVQAAEVLGSTKFKILFSHLLPNTLGPVLVAATLGVGAAILTESALSFLGLGVQPPTPSWGNILTAGKDYINFAWWLSLFPGLAILITVLGYNLVGEGLRDKLDPRIRI